ncbi:lipase 1 isoform X1 [Tribolium castaneum]|uniref:Lipase n=1 Tax=Tribolium castaneum TaxID=7070 RepID=A0A139WJB3_TRICA|nr:Lipase 1-like Protein [Tribolium castaneum]
MFILTFPFIFLSTIIKNSSTENILKTLPPSIQDEVNLTTPEIIAKYNYSSESHNVVTEDGYILTLHRILPKKPYKGSVLVMHGILASSADWIITGPQHGLGYLLSDEGYDVWLGNARGNRYSKNHTTLNPESKKFWDFSWHEIGLYDVPAMIDHILEVTKQEKIFHIAHSQGTTTFYVMCSLRPEYNSKIRAHFSLAPVAFVSHMFSPIFHAIAAADVIVENVAAFINLNEIMPEGGLVSTLGQEVCGLNTLTTILCSNTLFAICGFDCKQLNTTLLPLILAHVPAGCSTKQLLHYGQEINSGIKLYEMMIVRKNTLLGHFRQYDYGFWTNLKRYHSLKPPDYDLSQITTPLYFFYSKNDWISSAWDVGIFAKKLRSLKGKFLISYDSFNHMDYLFGIDARKYVYNKIISLMTRH